MAVEKFQNRLGECVVAMTYLKPTADAGRLREKPPRGICGWNHPYPERPSVRPAFLAMGYGAPANFFAIQQVGQVRSDDRLGVSTVNGVAVDARLAEEELLA
jgi:hypothetical protein